MPDNTVHSKFRKKDSNFSLQKKIHIFATKFAKVRHEKTLRHRLEMLLASRPKNLPRRSIGKKLNKAHISRIFNNLPQSPGKENDSIMRKNMCKRVLALVVFVFACGICNAHSWGEMVEWFREAGYQYVPKMGHPMDDVVSHNISDVTSEKIVVSYVYHDSNPWPFGIGDYTCKYEIRKGVKNGVPYFKTIKVLSEGYELTPSFSWWNKNTAASYAEGYERVEGALLYESSFWDLSLSQRAAFALMAEYIDYASD